MVQIWSADTSVPSSVGLPTGSVRPTQVNTFSSKFNEFDILQNLAAFQALNIIIDSFNAEIIQIAISLYIFS